MSSKHAIAHGFPIAVGELSRALKKHLEDNPNAPWSWDGYTPGDLLEDEGAIAVYHQAATHDLFTPIYGPMEVSVLFLENGVGDYTLIAATDAVEFTPGDSFTMELPSRRATEMLENFAEFLGRGELPEFQLHGGALSTEGEGER